MDRSDRNIVEERLAEVATSVQPGIGELATRRNMRSREVSMTLR